MSYFVRQPGVVQGLMDDIGETAIVFTAQAVAQIQRNGGNKMKNAPMWILLAVGCGSSEANTPEPVLIAFGGAGAARAVAEPSNTDNILGVSMDGATRPTAFEGRNGKRWLLAGEAKTSSEPMSEVEIPEGRVPFRATDYSDAELAALVQPTMVMNGAVYRLESLPLDLARNIKAGRGGGVHPHDPPAHTADGVETQIVIGTNDDRGSVGGEVNGVYSRHMSMDRSSWHGPNRNWNDCTASLIGRNTALTAAHCFFDRVAAAAVPPRNAWAPTYHWAFGVQTGRAIGGNTQTSRFGNYLGCYSFWIPTAYTDVTRTDSADFDYAAIEFGCNLNPGSTLGWYGSWTASQSEISGASIDEVVGYPANAAGFFQGLNLLVPSLARHEADGWVTTNTAQIAHTADTTGGQSGSPFMQNVFGGTSLYVTGVHWGTYSGLTSSNRARRFDATVFNFFKSVTTY